MYFIRKLFSSILVLLGVIILIFTLFQLLGDPAKLVAGQSGDKKTIDNIQKELNLDKPKWKQLALYINNISPISIYDSSEIKEKKLRGFFFGKKKILAFKIPYLGKSYQTKKEVTGIIYESIPGTLILALTAMIFACVLGISIGIIAALKKNSWIDHSIIITSITGISAPSFFIAIIIAYFFGIVLHQYTGLNFTGSLYEIDEVTGVKYMELKNLILPTITLGIRPLAIIVQLTRSSMLDVMNQDYIRTAFAKGLSKREVVLRHGIRNALNPIITTITGWFGELLAGAFFVEFIFGWKGLGKLTIDALEKLDYPIVLGAVLCSSIAFILINILSDFLYKKIDPRITG
ncbi:MAG: ABC transporter permease [Bacteroidota bacterium]